MSGNHLFNPFKRILKISVEQKVWDKLLKDDKFKCTCDEGYREDKFDQAKGHYHHCMMYQVSRAIQLTIKEMMK